MSKVCFKVFLMYKTYLINMYFKGKIIEWRKNYITKIKIEYVKSKNYAFLKIKKYFMKDKTLYLKKPCTLDA